LTIPKTGTTTFYISGEKESTKMNDVIIMATVNNSETIVGSTNVTVLWVNIKINTTGKLSKDNDKIAAIVEAFTNEDEKELLLGKGIRQWIGKNNNYYVHFCFALESEGSVSPLDFTSDLIFRRDAALAVKNDGKDSYSVEKKFRQKLGTVTKMEDKQSEDDDPDYPDDTSLPLNRDNTPPQIYDYDHPGILRIYDLPQKDIYKDKANIEIKQYFRVFVAYNDEERCSDILAYEIEMKVDFMVNINTNNLQLTIYKHEAKLNMNPNNAEDENDFYNYTDLNP
jgi:hypothetical protein